MIIIIMTTDTTIIMDTTMITGMIISTGIAMRAGRLR